MQTGKFNILLDCFWGSSGKGKTSAWLADKFNVEHISSSNYPNAGHTAAFSDGTKFIAKAIPTAAILKKVNGSGTKCYISPGSGFTWGQLLKEWLECGKPEVFIHGRASIVTEEQKRRESEGQDSTKHIGSTMQGSGTAIADKIMRRPDVLLAGNTTLVPFAPGSPENDEFYEKVRILDAQEFRNLTHSVIRNGATWLHEGSQGYALSIDHGSHYPFCTSRNCSVQAAMDHMAVPPSMVGDVYLNLRSFPIRVGHVVENGIQVGNSGGFYSDCKEMTWEEVARHSGMPPEEAVKLAERERTTVTKRIRRVTNFSFEGLRDAVTVNGATKLVLNFVQYLDWNDNGLKGGKEAFGKLSTKSRDLITQIEDVAQVPVVLVGTGALHDEMITLL
jgi:adenylosuccinate synthase